MIKAIFFDLDDTLIWDEKSVQEAFRQTCEMAQRECGVNPQQLEAAVRKEARILYASYETYPFMEAIGINPFEAMWGEFTGEQEGFKRMNELAPRYRQDAWTNGLRACGIENEELGQKLAAQFPIERRNNPFLYEETFEILDALHGSYKMVLMTNGAPGIQQAKLDLTPELAPYFDHVIISGVFGKGKPEKEIYLHALEQLHITADEALMVGDNLHTDIIGAAQVGIRTVWINRREKEATTVQPDYEVQHLASLHNILQDIY